jgi:hypothetical protein
MLANVSKTLTAESKAIPAMKAALGPLQERAPRAP